MINHRSEIHSFNKAAHQILSQAGAPLHYGEITKRALQNGLIRTVGKTPWATMNAVISRDIIKNGENSEFVRGEPGYYVLRNLNVSTSDRIRTREIKGKARIIRHPVNQTINSKQKGDIAEAFVKFAKEQKYSFWR